MPNVNQGLIGTKGLCLAIKNKKITQNNMNNSDGLRIQLTNRLSLN